MVIEFNESNFEQEVLKSEKLVVVDLFAEWCGPCKVISPIIDEVSIEFEKEISVGKVDVDNNSEIANKYNIRNIPTILFIKDGQVVDKLVGSVQKKQIVDKINLNL